MRISVALAGLLTLVACARGDAVSYSPRGKSYAQFNAENQTCSRIAGQFGNDEMIYAQCSTQYGNTVRLSDGRVLQPVYIPQPYTPTYSSPPPDVQKQPSEDAATEVPVPSTPPSGGNTLTSEQKIQIAYDLAVTMGEAYSSCKDRRHPYICGAGKILIRMHSDEKLLICTYPDILDQGPLAEIPQELKQAFLLILNCSSTS